jgi:hypothetical protein
VWKKGQEISMPRAIYAYKKFKKIKSFEFEN